MRSLRTLVWTMVLLLIPSVAPAPEETKTVLENGAGKFRIEIDGCPVASANVESITVEDLVIDEREVTSGEKWKLRMFEPGDAHFGSITISTRVGLGPPSCLAEWASTCTAGTEPRKNVRVTALRNDGTEGRTWDFFECWPVEYIAPPDPEAPDAVETIVIQPTGFACDAALAEATELDRASVVNGFAVELGESSTGAPGGIDPHWEFAHGGARQREQRALRFVDPTDETQDRLKGARSVTSVTLMGPVTDGRKALCQWITETVGTPSLQPRVNMTLQEIKEKGREKRFEYTDCFPTRYVFPAFSSSGTGNLYEEVTMKPIRLELS